MSSQTQKLSPKDIFEQGVEYLYNYLEPYGFKLLKNNEIIKKSEKFTARIFFFRNSRNYISEKSGKGSVQTEVHCLINTVLCEGAYRIRFGKGSSEWLQLLSSDLSLNTQAVDSIWTVIQKEFVQVIQGLEYNPHAQLLKMGLLPEVFPDNYSYTCYLNRQMIEIFEFQDLLAQYDKNRRLFFSPEVSAIRSQKIYFHTLSDHINLDYAKTLSPPLLYELLDEAYHFLKTTSRFDSYREAEYQYTRGMSTQEQEYFAVAVLKFTYCNVYVWFKDNPKIEDLNEKILVLHDKLIS